MCVDLSRTSEFQSADLLILRRIGSIERFDVLFDQSGEVNETRTVGIQHLVTRNAFIAHWRGVLFITLVFAFLSELE